MAIEEAFRTSKAIDECVIINFRDKNVVITRFRDKNDVIARFRDKTAYVWGLRYIDEILRYRGTWFPSSRTLCHPGLV